MNVMVILAFVAFMMQSSLIAVDEFICHRSRVLPRWELVGHPIDTFCLWAYLAALWFLDADFVWALSVAAILGFISCLVITKDEWEHKKHSSAFENWLHAMLFVIHPTVVLLYYYLWYEDVDDFIPLLHMSFVLVGSYFFFQCFMSWFRWQKV
jgi:hypothetical protein